MKIVRLALIVALALVPCSWAAQSQNQQNSDKQQQSNPQLTTASPQERQTRSEQRISDEVRHEVLMLPYYTIWDAIGYQVNGDTVTLTGKVRNATLKSDAENSVKHIEGVDKVVNNIQILPPSSVDDQIREAVARSVFGTTGLFQYSMEAVPPIHIIVENGHVTLVGTVNSEADKNLAGIKAKSVGGVFSVDNNLQVMNAGQ